MTIACPCGGETQVDHYDPPKRAVEWFLRCCVCARISGIVATPEEATTLSIEAISPDHPCGKEPT